MKALLAVLLAGAASAAVPEGWAPADHEPPRTAAPRGHLIVQEGEEGPHDEHNPVVHMVIAQSAFRLYASRYESSELARYIGEHDGKKPSSPDHDTVVAGAFEEDKSYKNPFNEVAPVMRHFWDCRDGDKKGLAGFDSGLNRSWKYWTGGFSIDGKYDEQWSKNAGKLKGARGVGALAAHRAGDKGKAYWYLGHVVHLLEDVTVPAHVLLWPHPFKGDAYEHYIKEKHARWPSVPSRPVESFAGVKELFYATCEVSNRYDAGTGEGATRGKDGEGDMGWRRDGGFTEEELIEEGDVLVPLAIRRVAALYLLFYKSLDKEAPRVTLEAGARADGFALRARAVDALSGVDREGYAYEWRRPGGEWAPAPGSSKTAFFAASEPGDYELRVRAVDAAGNAAWSKPVRASAAPLVAAAR
jgi:hypothetical protein